MACGGRWLGPTPDQWQFTDQDFRSLFPTADTSDAMSTNLFLFPTVVSPHATEYNNWIGNYLFSSGI